MDAGWLWRHKTSPFSSYFWRRKHQLVICNFFVERNLNPKAACLKRREEEKVEEEAPEKRAVPGVDKPFDTAGAAAGRGRGRRGRRSSRGGLVFVQ